MMMRPFRFLLHRMALQEVILFLFFFEIFRALGVVAFHLHALLVAKLRQVANKAHQLPTVLLRSGRAAKRGHPRETYSIFDDPEKFAVRELLRFLSAQVRRLGIKIAAYRRVSPAVIGVADGAMVREMQKSVAKILPRFRGGVFQLSGPRGENPMYGHSRLNRFPTP